MRCNFCDGTGLRVQGPTPVPCAECGGCGVAHCCDGLQACCEIEGDMTLETLNAHLPRERRTKNPALAQ